MEAGTDLSDVLIYRGVRPGRHRIVDVQSGVCSDVFTVGGQDVQGGPAIVKALDLSTVVAIPGVVEVPAPGR